jgi:hypothetical protein
MGRSFANSGYFRWIVWLLGLIVNWESVTADTRYIWAFRFIAHVVQSLDMSVCAPSRTLPT